MFLFFVVDFHLFSYIFELMCRATAVLRTPRFAHFSFPHLHISLFPRPPFPFPLFHISLFPLPLISLSSLLHFSIPEQIDHTCNFIDFYSVFQMVSWQRQIALHISSILTILSLKSKISQRKFNII